MKALDTIVFETPLVRAARFHVDVRDPRFRDSGPAENFAVCFPRTAVWIRYSDSRSFVADPSLATIYNPGQHYTRAAIAEIGDRCEWLGVSAEVALDIASSFDPHACDRHERPFVPQRAPVDRSLYLAQRAFFARLESRSITALEAEETIIGFVTAVIARAYNSRQCTTPPGEAHVELVEKARAFMSRTLHEEASIRTIAAELGISPFHLCRVFRQQTGRTLHEYRMDLRLRRALEDLTDPSREISRIAHEYGFSSHSHFTAAMRQRFGSTPSSLRKLLAG